MVDDLVVKVGARCRAELDGLRVETNTLQVVIPG
jgi:hypothetical protein